MSDLTEDMFDNESADTCSSEMPFSASSTAEMSRNPNVTLSSPGAMTPASTIMNSSISLERQEPTIIIVLIVEGGSSKPGVRQELEIKLRQNTAFGKLASLLRTKFDQTEKHVLHFYKLRSHNTIFGDWRIIFDTDTAASLNLKDRAQLRFEPSQTEALDVSKML
ncbi:hypothetical protein D6D04_03047 [Aureobasidium pullulans]|nr:hypothetical protein D6D04_03047 [Aureobasidium pullulans]